MKICTIISCVLMGMSSVVWAGANDRIHAAEADRDPAFEWQRKAVLAPSGSQLSSEKQYATVYIYQGMRDKTVNRAMDEQFDRLEYMMFVNTVVTDRQGKPKLDTTTGEVMTESDDC